MQGSVIIDAKKRPCMSLFGIHFYYGFISGIIIVLSVEMQILVAFRPGSCQPQMGGLTKIPGGQFLGVGLVDRCTVNFK